MFKFALWNGFVNWMNYKDREDNINTPDINKNIIITKDKEDKELKTDEIKNTQQNEYIHIPTYWEDFLPKNAKKETGAVYYKNGYKIPKNNNKIALFLMLDLLIRNEWHCNISINYCLKKEFDPNKVDFKTTAKKAYEIAGKHAIAKNKEEQLKRKIKEEKRILKLKQQTYNKIEENLKQADNNYLKQKLPNEHNNNKS